MKMLNMEEKGFMCVQQRWRNQQHKDGPGLKAHTGTFRRCSRIGHGSWEDIQEVLMRRAWVLGELGSHLTSQSHDPHEQETLKRNTIMKGTLCRLRRTMWLGPPQHHTASDSINVHNAEVFKGTLFSCSLSLHDSSSQDSWVMGEPFSWAEEISPEIQRVDTKERQGTKEEVIQPNRKPVYF